MRRSPVSECSRPTPGYPTRSARWSRTFAWARRVGAVVSASAVLSLSGCYDATFAEGLEPESDAGIADSGTPAEDSGFGSDGGLPDDGGVEGDGQVENDAEVVVDAEVVPPALETCEPDYRLSGDAPVTEYMFACGADMPEDTPVYDVPFWGAGRTCGAPGDWAQIEINEPQRIMVSFPNGVGGLRAEVFDPDGRLVGVIDEERPCIQFDAEAGSWSLAVRGGEILESPAYFELAVDPVTLPTA